MRTQLDSGILATKTQLRSRVRKATPSVTFGSLIHSLNPLHLAHGKDKDPLSPTGSGSVSAVPSLPFRRSTGKNHSFSAGSTQPQSAAAAAREQEAQDLQAWR